MIAYNVIVLVNVIIGGWYSVLRGGFKVTWLRGSFTKKIVMVNMITVNIIILVIVILAIILVIKITDDVIVFDYCDN
jgi:hypothetical protein